jgi:hypothetical protein
VEEARQYSVVSRNIWSALALVAIGAFFAVHCFRAGRNELRAGIAEGRYGTFRRGQPGFWPTIVLTFAASAMGVVFLVVGVVWALGSILAPARS